MDSREDCLAILSDFSGGIDELVYSVYLSSEAHLVLPVKRHHLAAYLADVYRLLPIISRCRRHSKR